MSLHRRRLWIQFKVDYIHRAIPARGFVKKELVDAQLKYSLELNPQSIRYSLVGLNSSLGILQGKHWHFDWKTWEVRIWLSRNNWEIDFTTFNRRGRKRCNQLFQRKTNSEQHIFLSINQLSQLVEEEKLSLKKVIDLKNA